MAKNVCDSKGLPLAESKQPSGILSVRLTREEWDMIRHLKALYEAERRRLFAIGDIVRAAIRQTYQRELDSVVFPLKDVAPLAPALAPIEEYEDHLKANGDGGELERIVNEQEMVSMAPDMVPAAVRSSKRKGK